MAAAKSKQFPHKWPDGSWHSIPYATHQQNTAVGVRQPWKPPPGKYDPNLDALERTARTGYSETIEDVGRQRGYGEEDYTLGLGDIERNRGEIGRQYGESLTDMLTARHQGQEDYQTNLNTLSRNFQRLGNTQAQSGRQHGLYGGGFQQQAAEKRATNMALEKAPIDTAFGRFMEGSQLAENRLGEARTRDIQGQERASGALGTAYGRQTTALTTQGRRAGTSLSDYIQDLAAARQAQYKRATGQKIPSTKKGKKK